MHRGCPEGSKKGEIRSLLDSEVGSQGFMAYRGCPEGSRKRGIRSLLDSEAGSQGLLTHWGCPEGSKKRGIRSLLDSEVVLSDRMRGGREERKRGEEERKRKRKRKRGREVEWSGVEWRKENRCGENENRCGENENGKCEGGGLESRGNIVTFEVVLLGLPARTH